jgi:folate-dependent phosphoribosylglycinamide formyltransferase PurN
MSVVLLTGNHPRHLFLAHAVARSGELAGLILEKREDHIPQPPGGLPERTRTLFVRHFAERAAAEAGFFGSAGKMREAFAGTEIIEISPEELNSARVWEVLDRIKPRLLLSYGVHKLTAGTLARVDGFRWNIHGGLSPWYRGVITHFWPSYLLEPQMTGMTVHETTEAIDGGGLIHQICAPLVGGDGIHDIACRAVSALAEELPELIRLALRGGLTAPQPQKTSGRIWRELDWRPCHLHVIYEQYGNRIVDRFLGGEFGSASPRLVRQV